MSYVFSIVAVNQRHFIQQLSQNFSESERFVLRLCKIVGSKIKTSQIFCTKFTNDSRNVNILFDIIPPISIHMPCSTIFTYPFAV